MRGHEGRSDAGDESDAVRLPMDAARLVPHRPPMLLVDRLLEVNGVQSLSELTVRRDMMFVGEDGVLDAAAYAEIMAQSLAAMEGFEEIAGRVVRRGGLLLGIKHLQVPGCASAGDVLHVSLTKVAKYGDFGIARGEVKKGTTLIAAGELKVWRGSYPAL